MEPLTPVQAVSIPPTRELSLKHPCPYCGPGELRNDPMVIVPIAFAPDRVMPWSLQERGE